MGDETKSLIAEPSEACPVATDDREHAVVGLWTALQRTTNLVRARLAQRIDAETGMLPDEVELLMQLAAAPERRLRMVDVSELLQVSKSGVTRLVDRLVERGLAVRAACPSDRRVVYAGITDEGLRALDAAGPAFVEGLMDHLGRHLSGALVAALAGDLRRILDGNSGERSA
jgi:DNA-binding MarR family transcriptional regulator